MSNINLNKVFDQVSFKNSLLTKRKSNPIKIRSFNVLDSYYHMYTYISYSQSTNHPEPSIYTCTIFSPSIVPFKNSQILSFKIEEDRNCSVVSPYVTDESSGEAEIVADNGSNAKLPTRNSATLQQMPGILWKPTKSWSVFKLLSRFSQRKDC